MKTLLFEEEYGVSIDDFEDIAQIDEFLEKKIGRSLEVADRRTSITQRGGNVFRVSRETEGSLESAISESMKAVEAQRARLKGEMRM